MNIKSQGITHNDIVWYINTIKKQEIMLCVWALNRFYTIDLESFSTDCMLVNQIYDLSVDHYEKGIAYVFLYPQGSAQ